MSDLEQIDPERNRIVSNLQSYFIEYDSEKKGYIPAEKIDPILSKTGFGPFPPNLIQNIIGVLDPYNEDQIYFNSLVWLNDYLSLILDVFNSHATDGYISQDKFLDVMDGVGYCKLSQKCIQCLYHFTDKDKTGKFNYAQLVSTMIFIKFSLNIFETEDRERKGVLEFEDMLEILPVLGIENASEEQARSIFDKFDLDKNGTLDPFEFIQLVLILKFPHLE